MSIKKVTHVFGGFKTDQGARFAIDQLIDAGVPNDAIGLLMSEKARRRFATIEKHTKAPQGIAAGGVAGGVLGALTAGLTAIAGIRLLVAGPLVSVLAGLGAGATAGGAVGGIIGLGIPEHEAKLYTQILTEDGVLVAVSSDDKATQQLARDVLSDAGAIQLAATTGQTARM